MRPRRTARRACWSKDKNGASLIVVSALIDRLRRVTARIARIRPGRDDSGIAEAAALIESERRFRLLVEGVVDYAIFMIGLDGRITSWNSGAERIKGYSASEIIGRHYRTFYTPEDAAAGAPERALRSALENGHFEAEGWRVRKDGTRFWAGVTLTRDRRRRGRRADRLRQDHPRPERAARDAAAAREGARAAFRGAEAGGDRPADRRRRARLQQPARRRPVRPGADRAHRRTQRAARLRAERDAPRRRARRGRDQAAPVLRAAPGRAARDARNLDPAGRDVALRRPHPQRQYPRRARHPRRPAGDRGRPAPVRAGAAQRLPQRARRHARRRHADHLRPRRDAATIPRRRSPRPSSPIGVTDTGAGIAPEALQRVFEPFFTTKEVGKGTGLGLSQAYGFATQSGGAIDIDSDPTAGTTVTFHLPVGEAPPLTQRTSPPKADEASGRRRHRADRRGQPAPRRLHRAALRGGRLQRADKPRPPTPRSSGCAAGPVSTRSSPTS